MRTWWLVLIKRSSSDSATTGFGNSGYQSLGARLLVRINWFGGDGAVGNQVVEIIALGRRVLTHRKVIDDQDQGSGVFAHALTDGAIGVSAGEVGEHPGTLDEANVTTAAGDLMAKCLCTWVFPTPTGP
jgi:hypothetical protein